MILADKIIEQRKKAGLSQEELAEKVGVSRQSVSKWEGAQSTPDMKKILALSEVFGVSTDYLLKDEIESPQEAPAEEADGGSAKGEADGRTADDQPLRPVDLETANAFLTNNERNAVLIAFGVMLCIFSPIALILLSTAGETHLLPVTEGEGTYIGLGVLLVLVAIAVVIFVLRGLRSEKFEYLKKEPLDTAYGIDGMVRERRDRYEPVRNRNITVGILLCVLSALPLFLLNLLTAPGITTAAGIGLLLALVGIGVFLIVKTATIWTGFQVLLEEGDYTRQTKRLNHRIGGIYWGAVTAVYLLVSFLTMAWNTTWIIWPVAGVLYGVVGQLYKVRGR